METRFTWDPAKAEKNLLVHGISFETVPEVFSDPNQVTIENEYARILLEQGLLGLIIWLCFIVWLLVAAWPGRVRQQYLGRLLLWCAVAFSFAGAPLGTGLLTAIPMTAILMLAGGWLIGRRREEELADVEPQTASRTGRGPLQVPSST